MADMVFTNAANGTPIINGVKVYKALITQAGTAAPTDTILENSLGGNVTWSRVSAGNYEGLLPITINQDKAYFPQRFCTFTDPTILISISVNKIVLAAGDDDAFTKFPIEFRQNP